MKNEAVSVRYGQGTVSITAPRESVVAHVGPNSDGLTPMSDSEIRQAIHAALCERRDPLVSSRRVLILVDDHTRHTPQHRLLPPILSVMAGLGITKEKIGFLLAAGTHDPPSKHIMHERYTRDICESYDWIIPKPSNSDDYVTITHDSKGRPLRVHRALKEADYVIGTGTVVPHDIAGFSGGAKIVLPGCACPSTVGFNHMDASLEQGLFALLGDPENSVRRQMESVAEAAGLRLIVNTVLSEREDIVGLFAGHPQSAHREACRLAARIYRPSVSRQADIVIASAYPCDSDYWQAIKTYVNVINAVKQRGLVVLVAECPLRLFGNATRHEACFRYAASGPQTVLDHADDFEDWSGISTVLLHARLLERARLAFLSGNLRQTDADAIGAELFRRPEDLQHVVDQAVAAGQTITTVDYGGWVAPKFQPA